MLSLELLYKVALITFFFSFGVQSLFYIYWKFWDTKFLKKHPHVFSYLSGVVGDGILIPLINVFTVITLYSVKADILILGLWILSLAIGFLVTFVFHFCQRHFEQKNWTMTEKGQWNLLGAYHSVFMFFETSFLTYGLVSYLKYLVTYGAGSVSYSPIKFVFLLLLLFLITFVFDYRHIVIKGKIL